MDTTIADKVEAFFTKFKRQTYKKGEILIRADDEPAGIFYLKTGGVKQYAISQKGDELVVNMFKASSFFPMSWAMNRTPNSYYFEAMSELEVWRAPVEQVVEFLKTNPDVLFDLLRRVYKGTDGILMRVTYLMSGSAYARLITELLIQARRFGKTENDVFFTISITEGELATSAGMTRETVSREMKRLKNRNLVSLQNGTIQIFDIQHLEEELSQS